MNPLFIMQIGTMGVRNTAFFLMIMIVLVGNTSTLYCLCDSLPAALPARAAAATAVDAAVDPLFYQACAQAAHSCLLP